MENTTIPDYEWNLWLEIMKEKGYNVIKYGPEIVMDFLLERGYLKNTREDIIKTLRENTEMTTSEITDALKKEVLSAKQIGKLQNTLNVSDLIKFAKAQADANMFDEFVDEAIDLVQETKEEEEETL